MLKLGRWLVIGLMASSSVAACGGRGNLPLSLGAAGDSDTEPFGGSAGVGGIASFGGSAQTFGGTIGTSGSTGVSGSFPIAGTVGVAGTGGLCVPGDSYCDGNSVTTCNLRGTALTTSACGKVARCEERDGVAVCVKTVCPPGQLSCDPTGRFVQVCSADGSSVISKADCGAMQRCSGGVCTPLQCQPDQRFCGNGGVYQCSSDGSGSTLVQACRASQFCNAGKCVNGVCPPNQLSCNGDVVALCKPDGSGFNPGVIDCANSQNRECVDGSCQCAPGLSDCDMVLKNGCEVDSESDPKNCGGCGFACSTNHVAVVSCNNSQCTSTCRGTFRDCNADKLSDGCETDVGSDQANCGGCGLSCSSNHVTPSCNKSVCNGACTGTFVDCNKDKQKDGCESDSAVDPLNCGACGVVCSKNHVRAACASGVCSGACAAGFADCNKDKQKDGCEVSTLTDEANCGACGAACAAGETCNAGKCSSLLTFSGIKQDLPVTSLAGWTQCFAETYDRGSTTLAKALQTCTGSLLMMACRPVGSKTLQLAAYAKRADVLFDVGTVSTAVHAANGVNWYFNDSSSWGFAPVGDGVQRNTCDVEDMTGPGGPDDNDGDLRLCWHTSGKTLQTGFRCGYDQLNGSSAFERLLFTAK